VRKAFLTWEFWVPPIFAVVVFVVIIILAVRSLGIGALRSQIEHNMETLHAIKHNQEVVIPDVLERLERIESGVSGKPGNSKP
jgi:hypothetical protein